MIEGAHWMDGAIFAGLCLLTWLILIWIEPKQ